MSTLVANPEDWFSHDEAHIVFFYFLIFLCLHVYIQVYGCGSGVDCRKHVQQLNTMRGEIASLREASTSAFPRNDHDEERGQMCEDVYADPHQENMVIIIPFSFV